MQLLKLFLASLFCFVLIACTPDSAGHVEPLPEAPSPEEPEPEDPEPVDPEEPDPVEPPDPVDPPPPGEATLKVISNRADLVSGDDVLVEVLLGSTDAQDSLKLFRNGEDVTAALQPDSRDETGLRLLGYVDGLVLGVNALSLNIGNSIAVTNHPIGGPVFTGPQLQPWDCRNNPDDAQCNKPIEYYFEYKSTNPDQTGLQPYDPANPPEDVATTTTDTGETIPFVVKVEKGYQARDEYRILTLHKPDEAWTPQQPQSQWNGRLMVTHGGNCRGKYRTSTPRFVDYAGTIPENPAIENSYITALGQGWSVLSTAQLNLGHNCNLSYQAESLMMAKERYVEQYGELRYTVGSGCSGGAITQNMIANAYPGLYQGLLTTCTYPDVMSTATQFADYHILLRYFDFQFPTEAPDFPDSQEDFQNIDDFAPPLVAVTTARDGTQYTVAEQNAIYGHENGVVNASLADSALFSDAVNPQSNCDVPGDQRYNSESNKAGTRCDVLTFMQNMVGPRARFDANGKEMWSDIEQGLGYGFAGFPLGNQGVQYGLEAMKAGDITPAQFVSLNESVGAVDMDLNLTEHRLQPDYPALTNAYRTGILNTVVNMDTVPIINMTGPDPGIAHDSVHGYWLRWRFEEQFPENNPDPSPVTNPSPDVDPLRSRSNFVMWGGGTVLIGNPDYMNQSLTAMASWLDAIEADTSEKDLAVKIIDNKPASVQDQCEGAPGMCDENAMAVYGTPRSVAGEGVPAAGELVPARKALGDQIQCTLRPFSRDDDYGPANAVWDAEEASGLVSPTSWERLEEAFMVNGAPMVCDWTKPPLGWTRTIPWLKYQDELGSMITGGEQMRRAAFPAGWASEAFHNTWEPGWQTAD